MYDECFASNSYELVKEIEMNRFEKIIKPSSWLAALLLTGLVAGCGGQDPILGTSVVKSGVFVPGNPGGNLGVLAPYGIAAYGGITDTGISKINGDVVLHPTYNCNAVPILFTDGPGFGNCGGNAANIPTHNAGDKVITSIYPDTTTAPNVMAALLAKWNSISPAGTPGATVLGCGTIGTAGGAGVLIGCAGNATLPPGTYISNTSTTIGVTGDLTLNGGPNDVWIFQAPSALTTANNSRILLTGGAKASNVWWFVGSSATLGTSATFNGNILASASITMQNLATSCGRLLAGAEGSGAFVLDTNTVSVPGNSNAPVGCQ
jgi:hypothetical protein